jgi:hypothetical protein
MLKLPRNPLAKHQRAHLALIDDLLEGKGFNRLDTLRYLNSREAGSDDRHR